MSNLDKYCKDGETDTADSKSYSRVSYFDSSQNKTVTTTGALTDNAKICTSPVRSGKSKKVKFKDAIRMYKIKVMLGKKEVSVEVKQTLQYPKSIGLV